MASFEGKAVAITSGASGIGLSIAKLIHSRGSKVSVADWSQDSLSAAPAAVSSDSSNITTSQLNVRNRPQVRDWLVQTKERFGSLTGVGSFAGIFTQAMGQLIEDQDEEDRERSIGVNLTGMMHCIKEEVKLMDSGTSSSMRPVLLASDRGRVPELMEYPSTATWA